MNHRLQALEMRVARLEKKSSSIIEDQNILEMMVKGLQGERSFRNESPAYIRDYAEMTFEVFNDKRKALGEQILEAKKRIPMWNGSVIKVSIRSFSWNQYSEETPLTPEYQGSVGQATFTIFSDEQGRIVGIDDILEDWQDFDSDKERMDYANLIQEIKKPGSTSSGKPITLYTSQPIGFDEAQEVRSGVFLTSDYSDAVGLNMDRKDREVYKVVLPISAVMQTLDRGRIGWYQVIKDTRAKISLV